MDLLPAVTQGSCTLNFNRHWKGAIDFTPQGDACESLTTSTNIKEPRGTASSVLFPGRKNTARGTLQKLQKTASALQ